MSGEREPGMDQGMGNLVLYRLTTMEDAVRTLSEDVSRLVLFEERQSRMYEAQERAFTAMGDLDKRVKVLELAEPITRRTNVWVERLAILVLGGLVAAFIKVLLGAGTT